MFNNTNVKKVAVPRLEEYVPSNSYFGQNSAFFYKYLLENYMRPRSQINDVLNFGQMTQCATV